MSGEGSASLTLQAKQYRIRFGAGCAAQTAMNGV
jgi:hypothetical protein